MIGDSRTEEEELEKVTKNAKTYKWLQQKTKGEDRINTIGINEIIFIQLQKAALWAPYILRSYL